MSSAAVRAVPSTNPSARVASRFGGDDDEESDFDCRESSIASTTSATSVASGTRIFRADATTASAEAEGRIPPIPRASAVFGATAEANPRSPIDTKAESQKCRRVCVEHQPGVKFAGRGRPGGIFLVTTLACVGVLVIDQSGFAIRGRGCSSWFQLAS